uniref:hypothetical protein n=1 Tax=Paractinoplanes polyasparticus TaxID=2856853 RepID=UPI001C85661C|nr:hypothetical protein [Actinoplanes polyasparticus]
MPHRHHKELLEAVTTPTKMTIAPADFTRRTMRSTARDIPWLNLIHADPRAPPGPAKPIRGAPSAASAVTKMPTPS